MLYNFQKKNFESREKNPSSLSFGVMMMKILMYSKNKDYSMIHDFFGRKIFRDFFLKEKSKFYELEIIHNNRKILDKKIILESNKILEMMV